MGGWGLVSTPAGSATIPSPSAPVTVNPLTLTYELVTTMPFTRPAAFTVACRPTSWTGWGTETSSA